ncbi:MAG TPA: hypothetical protein PKA63_01885 [Oligoflexia bacterium]|nr:hypothetical protein [Oligoflexia bacterium]HMP47400.1 hypothetical protein [Oligoflexia bacterium]
MRLVNHSLRGSYPEEELRQILGVWRYSGRVLGSTDPEDILQLHPDLRPDFQCILDHYATVGLPVASEVIWDDRLEVAWEYPNTPWDVFLYSDFHYEISPDWNRKEAVKLANNKNDFMKICCEFGVQTPFTQPFVYNGNKVSVPRAKMYPAFLKKAVSASGAGVFEVKSHEEVLRVLSEHGLGDWQIQEKVDGDVSFWNVQYKYVNDRAVPLMATQQILSGFEHAGNKCTAQSPLCLGIGDKLADKLVHRGIKGIFAFDVAVSGDHAFVIECNPRPNGCTYYSEVARKLRIKTWFGRNVKVNASRLSELNLDGITFNNGSGLVIVNWGTISMKKLGVLFCGETEEDAQQVYEEFQAKNSRDPVLSA